MNRSTLPVWMAALLAGSAAAASADTCDAVREGIEKKIRAAGVSAFTLEVIDAAASAPGKVVGNCARGARIIVYRRDGAGTVPALITECRDGSAPVNGACPKK